MDKRAVREPDATAGRGDAELAVALSEARETNRRLNRRLSLAEGALATKVEDFEKRSTGGLRAYYFGLGVQYARAGANGPRDPLAMLDSHIINIRHALKARRSGELLEPLVLDVDQWLDELGEIRAAMLGLSPSVGKSRSPDTSTVSLGEAEERSPNANLRRLSLANNQVRYLLDGHDETLAFSTGNDAAKVWELMRRVSKSVESLQQQLASQKQEIERLKAERGLR